MPIHKTWTKTEAENEIIGFVEGFTNKKVSDKEVYLTQDIPNFSPLAIEGTIESPDTDNLDDYAATLLGELFFFISDKSDTELIENDRFSGKRGLVVEPDGDDIYFRVVILVSTRG